MTNHIFFGDNLPILRTLPASSVSLIYIDPPFNTGQTQEKTQIRTERAVPAQSAGSAGLAAPAGSGAEAEAGVGDRTGFGGRRYKTVEVGTKSYEDSFDDYIGFLEPRLREAYRLLAPNGTLYFHIDPREGTYCRILLDQIFGRECFLNEIVWAYDYGARSRKKWPTKHDNILVYVKDPGNYIFNYDAIDRIPYMAPGLVGPEKAARGKTVTDVWWHTIVGTNSKEKTGYPTQKPLDILKRIIAVSSNPGDTVLDFFAGSGTTGAACLQLGRRFILIDNNAEALRVMARRFQGAANAANLVWHGFDPVPFQD